MIKAVVLDLDDTLYAFEPLDAEARVRVRAYACEKLHITAQRYEEAFDYGRRETKRRLGSVAASHNRLLYFQTALEHMGVNPVPIARELYEMYWDTVLHKMKLNDGAREFLDRMHACGIKVMLCTDLTAHIQYRKIEALGIAGDIFGLVTSEEAGREKPAPEIFALCLAKLGLPAAEVCCVGDSPEKDVAGARAAGMQAVLFQPDQPSAQQFEKLGEIIGKR